MMMTNAEDNKETLTASAFGLIGGFPGDDDKFRAAVDMVRRLSSTKAAFDLSAAEVVRVLDRLPMKGRFNLVLQGIGPSPASREIVKKLFDWCFEEGQSGESVESWSWFTTKTVASDADDDTLDQDFVVVSPGTRDLNPMRSHVLRVLSMTAGGLGEAGVELCLNYLKTSSTIFRVQIVRSMCKNRGVTDDELERVYDTSVVADQEKIVSTCQHVSHRCKFLIRLYQKGQVPFTVLYAYPDSAVIRPILEKDRTTGFRKWKHHAPLYIGMLEESFRKLSHHPLGRGTALREWEKRCEGATDFTPEHAMQVLLLCDAHRPMEVVQTTDKYVESILFKASTAGELGTIPTDLKQVVQAYPACCKKVNKHEFMEWIVKQVQPCSDGLGVGFVDPTQETFLSNALVSRKVYRLLGNFIPEYLDKVLDELFWRALRENDTSKATCSIRFFRLIASLCVTLSSKGKVNLAREATRAWCRLHMRCKPPKLVPNTDDKDDRQENVRSDWSIWCKRYTSVISNLSKNVAGRHTEAIRRSAPTGLSSATLWVGFSRIVLGMEIDGLITMYKDDIVDKQAYVLSMFNALELVERESHRHGDFQACRALAEEVVAMCKTNVLPVLETFDAAKDDERHFITRQLVPLAVRLCQGHFKDRAGFLVSMAGIIRAFSQQALPPETLVNNPCFDKSGPDADGRMVRVFYRADVKERQVSSESLMTNVLTVFEQLLMHCSAERTKAVPGCHIAMSMPISDMQREIRVIYSWFPVPEWMLRLRDGKEDLSQPRTATDDAKSVCDRLALVRRVAAAWPLIVEQETPLLVALGKWLLTSEDRFSLYEEFCYSFIEWGINDTILEGYNEELRHTFSVVKNPNTSAPGVRPHLESKTTGRDPSERMNGYVTLLKLSLATNLKEFAQSVQFVANRTKNEAGIYRSTILDHLVKSAYSLTEQSFAEVHRATSAEQEKGVINAARAVCGAFTKMFRDDVAKRDSVGRNRFLSISNDLLRFCFGAAARRLAYTGLELHTVWVNEALRLQWINAEVAGGEAQLRNFNWQLPTIVMSDNWVDNDALVSLLDPFLDDRVLMRRIVASVHYGRHWSDATQLCPAERVSLLQAGLLEVQKEHVSRTSDSSLVADGRLSELQLNSLFSLVKQRWVEVPVLVKALEEAKPESGFDRAYRLFTRVCSLFTEQLWCHVPLLASVCESMLRTAIKQNHSGARQVLNKYWLPMRRRLAAVDFSAIEKDPGLSSFFLSLFGGPLKNTIATTVQKRARLISDEFACSVARTLLDMTKSSWYLPEVKGAVEKSRDDVLADLLESGGNSASFACGVFCNAGAPAQAPFNFIQSAVGAQLRSQALRLYADVCLSDALSKNQNVQLRCSRVSEFVESSCTGYRDILRLLEELEEGPLLETLLLSIFRVDGAWKVLAYLLRPSVIAKRSPRMTGGLLDRVAKEMHARDVELVLSVLLKEGPRQKALTPYLMKCILRALFDIESETAAGLIRRQWNRGADLHKDVRYDLVRLAVLAVVPSLCGTASGSGPLSQVAWDIVESACEDSDLELDSAALVLAPRWTHSSSAASSFVWVLSAPTTLVRFQLPSKSDSAKTEAFNTFQSKLSKARENSALNLPLDCGKLENSDTRDAVNRYGKALRVLSEKNSSESVRVIARCHSYIFVASCLLGIEEDKIGTTLKELQTALEAILARTGGEEEKGDFLDIYENYECVTLAALLAILTMIPVERQYWNLPAEVRAKDATEAITSVMKESHCIKILVAFLQNCVEALLSTPPRSTSRTLNLSAVLHVVSDNADRFNFPLRKISDLLLESLSEQIRTLKLAGSAMNSM